MRTQLPPTFSRSLSFCQTGSYSYVSTAFSNLHFDLDSYAQKSKSCDLRITWKGKWFLIAHLGVDHLSDIVSYLLLISWYCDADYRNVAEREGVALIEDSIKSGIFNVAINWFGIRGFSTWYRIRKQYVEPNCCWCEKIINYRNYWSGLCWYIHYWKKTVMFQN